jgi:glycosyltransferase involved in cell wall biosynthesis
MKIALVYDWYTQIGGAEKCNSSINNIWGEVENYALVDFLSDQQRNKFLKNKNVKTSFIQKLPFARKYYRKYFLFFPFAIEQFDLKEFDLVISSSSSVSKGVITNHSQFHVSYVHSPARYAWDLYHDYLTDLGLTKSVKGFLAKLILHYFRLWDKSTSNRPDLYIANSINVSKRIRKIYNKESVVIYPPVDVNFFKLVDESSNYFVTFSRMVPYKKIDLIVDAFSKTKHKLIVIGDGPEMKKVIAKSSANIDIMGFVEKEKMIPIIQRARAFVFMAEEDFGISPVEAQACGIPVVAYGKGGILETILGKFPDQKISSNDTGVFFKEQTKESLLEALDFFVENEAKFQKKIIRKNALRFSTERFESEMQKTVIENYQQWSKVNF